MKTPRKWPVIVKKGNVTAKIYRAANRKTDAVYTEFKVVYYDTKAKRVIKTFAKYNLAKRHAEQALGTYTRGDAQGLNFSSDDWLIYSRAKKTVQKLAVPLDSAAEEYVEARLRLGRHRLEDAVTFFLQSCGDLKSRTVKEVVDEFLDSRRKPQNRSRPASPYYLQDLESRLGKFAGSFACPIQDVRREEIGLFLDALKGTGRTWFNYARILKTLFRYAQSKEYYPKTVDPFQGIPVEYEDDGEIEIFSAEEFRQILRAATSEMVPFLVIGAFGGLRHFELHRLDWAEVGTEYIEVKKGKAKTRSRRLVPITANLNAWLAFHRQAAGRVVPFENIANQIGKMVVRGNKDSERKSLAWKFNGLRHSFISYRMAMVQNENQVAAEAGNSPTMIFQYYRQLVTKAQAEEWFSIIPTSIVPPESLRRSS